MEKAMIENMEEELINKFKDFKLLSKQPSF